jgi:caffeoyl-CoA O-methyltransferase
MRDARRFEPNAAQRYLESLLPEQILRLDTPRPPNIERVAPTIGPAAAQLLTVLIHATRPRHALEIGTCLGYAAVAIGRALQQLGTGTLTTIEIDPRLADAARQNLAHAGLSDNVEVITGDANRVIAELSGPFDLILQDGHKPDYVPMLPRFVELLAPHGLLVTDDVLFPVMDLPQSARPAQATLRAYNDALRDHPDLHTTWLPIGDGVTVSVKLNAGAGPIRSS